MGIEGYIIATILVVAIFLVVLKKVFNELDAAKDFKHIEPSAHPKIADANEPSDELDDLAASEFVRRLLMLYKEFSEPDKEISLQLQALLQGDAEQIKHMLARLLPAAEESIKKAYSSERAAEFYNRAGEIYEDLKRR